MDPITIELNVAEVIGAATALIAATAVAIVGLLKGSAEAARTRVEVAAMRADIAKSKTDADARRKLLEETHHQVMPNGGSSIADSSSRNEVKLGEIATIVGELVTGQARHGADIQRLSGCASRTADDVRGIKKDVGRLADADLRDREAADQAHKLIHQRIDDLTG